MKTLLIVEFPHNAKVTASLAKRVLKGTVFAYDWLDHLRNLPQNTLDGNTEYEF